MFITHRPTLTLQLHSFDLFRTWRTSSFCTVAWQLARFQLTLRIARYLGDSWASYCKQPQQPDFHFKISGFLAAIKLTDKSGCPDNGYANSASKVQNLQTMPLGELNWSTIHRLTTFFDKAIISESNEATKKLIPQRCISFGFSSFTGHMITTFTHPSANFPEENRVTSRLNNNNINTFQTWSYTFCFVLLLVYYVNISQSIVTMCSSCSCR